MTGVGLLDGIDRESANGVDAELVKIRLGDRLANGLTHRLTHMDSWARAAGCLDLDNGSAIIVTR
jgi:hypothetical protein